MLEQHFASSDPNLSHAMYHDDALLEFPQSGERFVGLENFRDWRSNYPSATAFEFREIRGRDDLWVAEVSISYDQGPSNPRFRLAIDCWKRLPLAVANRLGPSIARHLP